MDKSNEEPIDEKAKNPSTLAQQHKLFLNYFQCFQCGCDYFLPIAFNTYPSPFSLNCKKIKTGVRLTHWQLV